MSILVTIQHGIKNTSLVLTTLFLFILGIWMLPASIFAADATDIIRVIEKNLAPTNFVATYYFKNVRLDGTISEYKLKSQGKNSELIHMYFMAPEREKGREVLRNGDSMWTFAPSIGRVVRIEDRDSFAGGDFSNADILRIDWLARYNATMIKETDKQWIIDLTAKGKDATYARMRLWVQKSDNMPVQQYFYDSNNVLLKQCLYGSNTKFGSITRPARAVMQNMITNQKSEMRVLSLSTEQDISESRFVVSSLGK